MELGRVAKGCYSEDESYADCTQREASEGRGGLA